MPKYKYFTLQEFIKSPTAEREGIDNTPDFDVVEHIAELTTNILEPLRAAYGKPIRVTSGYRCKKLNKAVGGVNGSAHLSGYAADLQASDMKEFKRFVCEWIQRAGIKFDQCIIEKNISEEWVHIGLYSSTGSQRGQLFQLQV